MSEYGPAVFISHSDGAPISQAEQETIKMLIQRFVTELKVVAPMDDEPSEPEFYDYDGYETGAVGFVLYSDHAFGEALTSFRRT